MYPSIPVNLVKNIIKNRWSKIKKFRKLPYNEFINGLEVLMNSLYFKYDEKYYQQINGLPIGLSVSPVLADLVIQDIEESVLNKYKKFIIHYGRYVDDSYLIVEKEKIKQILEKFNNYEQRIKFTQEIEENSRIRFLDTLIIKNNDGSISIDIYKKPTFSGRYINFLSSHSMGIKIGIVKSLVDKVIKNTDSIFHQKNIENIKIELMLNNYPKKSIEKYIDQHIQKIKISNNNNNNDSNNTNVIDCKKKFKTTIIIPMIPIVSNNLKYMLKKKLKKNTMFRNPFKLNKIIKLGKDLLKKC